MMIGSGYSDLEARQRVIECIDCGLVGLEREWIELIDMQSPPVGRFVCPRCKSARFRAVGWW